jgi:hypothetical protein
MEQLGWLVVAVCMELGLVLQRLVVVDGQEQGAVKTLEDADEQEALNAEPLGGVVCGVGGCGTDTGGSGTAGADIEGDGGVPRGSIGEGGPSCACGDGKAGEPGEISLLVQGGSIHARSE